MFQGLWSMYVDVVCEVTCFLPSALIVSGSVKLLADFSLEFIDFPLLFPVCYLSLMQSSTETTQQNLKLWK